jgi:thioredoxin 1
MLESGRCSNEVAELRGSVGGTLDARTLSMTRTTGVPLHLTGETFGAAIACGSVLVWWWSPSYGPCRAFEPIYSRAIARHPNVTFASVNTEAEPALARAIGIRKLPTLMAFRNQLLVFARSGFIVGESLEALIRGLQAVDVRPTPRRGLSVTRRACGFDAF